MSTPIDLVVEALRAHDRDPRQVGGEYRARCPAPNHGSGRGDRCPSLSIAASHDGRALLRCFAGCSTADVLAALELTLRDLYPRAGNQTHRGRLTRVVASRKPAVEQDRAHSGQIAAEYRAALTPDSLTHLAHQLSLSETSLAAFEVGWDGGRRAWSFPMRDGDGRLTGFRLRRLDGSKYTLRGTHEGLFIPSQLEPAGRLFVAEGPTDAAALLQLGFPAIGRPSCTGGSAHVVRLVRRLDVSDVVIAADRDAPGQRGAASLVSALILFAKLRVITPPAKDIRDWVVQDCATTAHVESLVADAPLVRLRAVVCRRDGGGQS